MVSLLSQIKKFNNIVTCAWNTSLGKRISALLVP